MQDASWTKIFRDRVLAGDGSAQRMRIAAANTFSRRHTDGQTQ